MIALKAIERFLIKKNSLTTCRLGVTSRLKLGEV